MTVFPVMLGYNRSGVIEGGMQNFAKTVDPDYPIKKIFIELNYPLNGEDGKKLNAVNCEKFGWDYFEFENDGVMANWNKVIHEIPHS